VPFERNRGPFFSSKLDTKQETMVQRLDAGLRG